MILNSCGIKKNCLRMKYPPNQNTQVDFKLNRNYNSKRFKLKVSDYLNKDGGFTLNFEDNKRDETYKIDVFIIMKNLVNGETFSKKIYSVLNEVEMIDDNNLRLDCNGNYTIIDQGKSYGFSEYDRVVFFPNTLKEGLYDFQTVIQLANGEKVYSNIVNVKLPIKVIEYKY